MTAIPLARPEPGDRWLGVDAAMMRFLDWHEARAHAIGGRQARDLGDAILLHDPNDRDPFWNRLSGLRLPEDAEAFDGRLAELLALFAGLDRRPHVWASPIHQQPDDLGHRLVAHGFHDLGGGLMMVHADRRALVGVPRQLEGVDVERHRCPLPAERDGLADETAGLLVAAFRVDPLVRGRLAVDLLRSLAAPELTLYLARVDGIPVAAAKRLSFDGASYLSSIGTRPGWQGRGIGEGDGWIYLGVFSENRRARALYERLGFAALGGPAGDYLLR
jgi:ribosomal protein S18 acetylase RimI-like enzyme